MNLFALKLEDKQFLKMVFAIAVPISLQSLIQSGLSMIDQMMIGKSGEAAIAGVGLGGTISFILMITLGGVVTGGSIFMAQFSGAKDAVGIQKTMVTTSKLGIAVSVFLGLCAVIFPNQLLGIFIRDTQVIEIGARYLRIVAVSYLPMFLIMNFSSLLRNTGNVRLPMYTGIAAVAVNTSLNYVLIFGAFGLPALGVEGAAYATLLTRLLESLALFIVLLKVDKDYLPTLKDFLRLDWAFDKRFLKTVYPVFLNELIWVLGDAMYSVIYGHMGTSQMAAMTMTFPVQGMFIGLFTGLSSAAGILIGNLLGQGDVQAAGLRAKQLMRLTLLGGIAVSVVIVGLAPFYVSFYSVSGEASDMAIKLLRVFGVVIWMKVANMVLGNGILRSGGQTKFTFYVDILGLWGIGVPLGFLAAFILNWSIVGVYLLIAIEELVRLILCYWRLRSDKWQATLTSV